MTNILWGIASGIIFGAVSVGMMLPMTLPDKRTAILAAFVNRFGIGLVVGCARMPWPGWAVGLLFGLLLSLPDAIISKAYPPILVVGGLGGLIIGSLIHGWVIRV